jgi:hypothetical protein
MYGHEVLMSFQTRANILMTHSNTSVRVSLIRYFNMTSWSGAFFIERVHNDYRVKLMLKVAVLLLLNYKPTFRTAYNELLIVDSRSVLLSYHFALKSPRYCSGDTQKQKHSSLQLVKNEHRPNLT